MEKKIQSFPWKNWRKEFQIASKIGLSLIEWTIDRNKFFLNPINLKKGRDEINYLKKNNHLKNLEESYIKILTCFSPIIPHFSSECLEDLKYNDNLSWPKYDNALLDKEKINVVIQINGRKTISLFFLNFINIY